MVGIPDSVKCHLPTQSGELDDDREELLIAADFARNPSYQACEKPFWENMECYFTSVTSQDESYLKHQLEFDAFSGSLYNIPGDEDDDSDDLKLQQHPVYSGGRRRSPADQESIGTAALTPCYDITKNFVEAPSLRQRVISAIIVDDESKEMSLHSEGRNDFQCASDDSHFEAENRYKIAGSDINCEAKGRHMDDGVHPQLRKQGVLNRISKNDMGSSLKSITSPNCNYCMLSVDDKLRVGLQSIDLYPEMIAEGEDALHKDIIELEAGLAQQALKKKKYMRKIYDSIQHGKDAENRNLEQAALSKLIETAYEKLRVSHMGHSSKRVFHWFPIQVALSFAERTLARCREFEDTSTNNKDRSSPNQNLQPPSGSSDKQQFKGMHRDLLPNDVCSDFSRGMPGGSAKRKRSEGAEGQTTKNISHKYVSRILYPPVGSCPHVRESKLKPKVKATNLASAAEPGTRYMEPTHAASDSPQASCLLDLDVDDGMQDQDWIGLDIPMDDLLDVPCLSRF